MKTQFISFLLAASTVLCAGASHAQAGFLDSVSSAVDSAKTTTNEVSNANDTAKDPKGTMKRKAGLKGDDDPSKNSMKDNGDNVDNLKNTAKDPVNTLNPLNSSH